MSPRCTSTSPVRSTGHSSWIRPERSTRSRKVSLPISRRASTRPASRRLGVGLGTGLETLGLRTHCRDLVAVGKAPRRSHPSSLVRAAPHHPGTRAVSGRLAFLDDLEAVGPRRSRHSPGCSSGARTGSDRASTRRDPAAAMRCQCPPPNEPARRRSPPGTSGAQARPQPASPPPRVRRRGSATVASRTRIGVATSARSIGATWIWGRPGGSQRAQPSSFPSSHPDLRIRDLEVHAEEPR